MSDRPAKIHRLDMYRKIPSVYFHKTSFFGCVFNEVKLILTPHHILTLGKCVKFKRMGAKQKGNGPSPASAGSSGAKIWGRFVLDVTIKNSSAVAPLENIYLTHSSSWANRLHCSTVPSCPAWAWWNKRKKGFYFGLFVTHLRTLVFWWSSIQRLRPRWQKLVPKNRVWPGGRGASLGFADTGCWHGM